MRVSHLTAESRVRPIGLDRRHPQLGWRLEADRRGQRQTAYQIVVATSRSRVLSDRVDVWDSGKTASDESIGIEYQGPPLTSDHRYYWRARAWDQDDVPSRWSDSSWWQVGLLDALEWRGMWVGSQPRGDLELSFEGASWIWAAEATSGSGPYCYVRGAFVLPGRPIRRALLGWTASRGIARAWINGHGPWRTYVGWEPTQVDVTRVLREGENIIAVRIPTGDDRQGLICRLRVTFDDGETEELSADGAWRSLNIESPGWQEPGFNASSWPLVRQVAIHGADGWPSIPSLGAGGPSPCLRREFQLDASVRSATLYAAALGLYTGWINGRAISDDRLAPGWTDYARRVPWQAHDVTRLLQPGANAIGVVLGDGWYAGHVGMFPRQRYGDRPAVMIQLNVQLTDGTRHEIVSDGRWRVADGPIRSSDLLMGEEYDARREFEGWTEPDFDDSDWAAAEEQARQAGTLVAQSGPSTRVINELRPRDVIRRDGRAIYDFGENVAGWCRLRISGPRGTEVTLRHGEMLNDDGTLYTANLRNASQTDRYVLKGGGEECFEPLFTYHGFRYVELTADSTILPVAVITARVASSLTGRMNRLRTSIRLVNRLQANIGRSQRANSISVPTDCPQRDERLGWTGDSVVFASTAACNFDVLTFYRKWLDDVSDAQLPSGAVPDVVPRVGFLEAGNAGWGDAVVVVPWILYATYGDRRILGEHYEAMQRWLTYLEANSVGYLRPATGPGDWLAFDEPRKDLVATAYFARSADLLSRIARVLGKQTDAATYAALAGNIRAAFTRAFVGRDGTITGGTQTAHVLALAFDLLPAELRGTCADLLAADIVARDDHLSTGFLGTAELLPVLSASGHSDVAVRLLLQETLPSWLFSVRHGATSIWERWDGWTPDRGFADDDMNSFNHWSLASVGQWLFSHLAGIQTDPGSPGFKLIRIRPEPSHRFTFVRARMETIRGPVASAWSLAGDEFKLQVEIPTNASALIVVPSANGGPIMESGRAVAIGNGIERLRPTPTGAEILVGSGVYEFASQLRSHGAEVPTMTRNP